MNEITADEANAAALVRSGEAVLDIGCGCADTSFTLLDSVGVTGRVHGVDISGPMLETAMTRAKQLPDELQGALDFEHADARKRMGYAAHERSPTASTAAGTYATELTRTLWLSDRTFTEQALSEARFLRTDSN